MRYRFAGNQLRRRFKTNKKLIVDIGCGCGYGSWILAHEYGFEVIGIDLDEGAIMYAREHYSRPRLSFECKDAVAGDNISADAIVAFELIEHIPNGMGALNASIAPSVVNLVGSVPNQNMIPYDPNLHPWHVRHYTPREISVELQNNDWVMTYLGGQYGKKAEAARILQKTKETRTIVFAAARRIPSQRAAA